MKPRQAMIISPRGSPTPSPTLAVSDSPGDRASGRVDEEGGAAELIFEVSREKKGDSLELRFGLAMKKQ
jgi:hypothetical protein